MEWVETTARTIDDAKDLALDQLGVAADDAEFEILDEPRAGLFGRLRGEARVRARVRPTHARQKVERRQRRPRADRPTADAATGVATEAGEIDGDIAVDRDAIAPRRRRTTSPPPHRADGSVERARTPRRPRSSPDSPTNDRETQTVDAAQVGEAARRFVDELVDAFGLAGTTTVIDDDGDLEVRVEGSDLGLLVGPKGATLQAVQDLTRVAAQQRLNDHETRLRVDVGGYRARRREALGRFALKVADEVTASGAPRALEPMSSADRKVIHDTLTDVGGVSTRSEGDDPFRRVIVDPVDG